LATQPHPYHRADPLPGRQWGDVIKGLGNASKHFKLTAQNVEEKLEQYKHGSFRCMGTKIKVETPTRDICGWSFIDIGGLDSSQSRSLRSELQSRKLIHNRRVCWSTHPILDRVVRAAAYDHDQKPPRQELVALLRSFADPKLNAESATAVADFHGIHQGGERPIRACVQSCAEGLSRYPQMARGGAQGGTYP
jgi:hypothetical protein